MRKAPAGCFWREGVLFGRARIKGKLYRWSLHTDDPKLARKRRQEGKDRLNAGTYHGDARLTFDEVMAEWAVWIQKQVRPKTVKRYAVSLAQLQPYLQGKFLDQIDDRLLIDIQDGLQVSNATLKRDLGALSSVLNFSIDRGYRKDNPVLPRLRRIKERRDPIVLPVLADVERLIARAPGLLSKMVQAARVTGARQDELATALRSQLDLPNRRLTLIGKGNKRRVIDLTAFDGYKVFEDLPIGKYLFWHHDGERYKTTASRVGFLHRQLTKRCPEYKRFPFHNLRHLHAVEWLQSGRSIYDLQHRLGHTSIKTTEGYLEFLTPEEKRVSQGVSQKVSQTT